MANPINGRLRNGRLILVCLLPLVLAGCRLLPREDVEDIPVLVRPPAEELVTHVLTTGPIDEELNATGRVGSGREQQVYFVAAGRIREVLADYGDEVRKGQPLIVLETGELGFLLKQAQIALEQEKLRLAAQSGGAAETARLVRLAELEVARAELDLAQAEERLKAEGDLCPAQQRKSFQRDVERARLTLAQAKLNQERQVKDDGGSAACARSIAQLNVERARLECARLQEQMDDSVLRAPFAGKVTSLSAARGRMVEAFAPLATISDMQGLEMLSEVAAADIYRLRHGQRVKVRMGEGPPRTGRITKIEELEEGGAGTVRKWRVHIRMDDPRFPLIFDDYYTIAFVLRSAAGALLAPNDAVREDVNGKKYLRIIEGKHRRDVYIKIGLASDTHTQILEGAEPGMVALGK